MGPRNFIEAAAWQRRQVAYMERRVAQSRGDGRAFWEGELARERAKLPGFEDLARREARQ